MDILLRKKESNQLFLLVISFILGGFFLLFLTWQNINLQKKAIYEHLELAASSISKGIEASLFRGMMFMRGRMMEGMMRNHHPPMPFLRPRARDILTDLVQEGDVLAIILADNQGNVLPILRKPELRSSLKTFLTSLSLKRPFQIISFGDNYLALFKRKTRIPVRELFPEQTKFQNVLPPENYLVLVLNATQHLTLYKRFQKTLFIQSGFLILLAIFLITLTNTYLKRRQKSERLIQLETFHSKLLDNLPDGIFTVDKQGIITSANQALSNILNKPLAEILGKPFSSFFTSNLPEHKWISLEKDKKSLELLKIPLTQEYLFLLRDRTELKKMEEELLQNQKLATIGRFATGMAHEIRNPLNALKGFAQFFAQKFTQEEPAKTYAHTMVQEADRLNRVITDLLTFARPKKIEKKEFKLKPFLEEIIRLLQFDLQKKNLRTILEIETESIQADQDGLKQALLNLILNSIEASYPQGTIKIHAKRLNSNLKITIEDFGQGMDEATLKEVFTPFFTTKDKGTGLGMSIVHKIITEHAGNIDINSTPNQGTKVEITLPYEQ